MARTFSLDSLGSNHLISGFKGSVPPVVDQGLIEKQAIKDSIRLILLAGAHLLHSEKGL